MLLGEGTGDVHRVEQHENVGLQELHQQLEEAHQDGQHIQAAMDKLLEEGDYSRGNKARKDVKKTISLVYWLAATAVFLVVTFGPSGNGNPQYSWIVWAVAGVLYGAVMGVASLLKRKE